MSSPSQAAEVSGQAKAGQSRKAQEVTTRLLDAGVEMFGETGYETTRIHEVARRCGLTTGAIYARWPTKPQLFLAVVEHATSQRMASMADPAETPVDESIGALGASLLSSGDRRLGDLVFETFVSARHDDSIAALVSECLGAEVDTLTAMVTAAKEDGRIDPSLSTEAIVAFCQALDLGAHLALSAGAPSRSAPTAQQWQALMKRVIEAVAAPRSDERPEDA